MGMAPGPVVIRRCAWLKRWIQMATGRGAPSLSVFGTVPGFLTNSAEKRVWNRPVVNVDDMVAVAAIRGQTGRVSHDIHR